MYGNFELENTVGSLIDRDRAVLYRGRVVLYNTVGSLIDRAPYRRRRAYRTGTGTGAPYLYYRGRGVQLTPRYRWLKTNLGHNGQQRAENPFLELTEEPRGKFLDLGAFAAFHSDLEVAVSPATPTVVTKPQGPWR